MNLTSSHPPMLIYSSRMITEQLNTMLKLRDHCQLVTHSPTSGGTMCIPHSPEPGEGLTSSQP